jgi:uncharacterized membrane protein YedE/YeeE
VALSGSVIVFVEPRRITALGLEAALENFTPLSALGGGLLIGISATMLLLLQGRLAGISGILGGLWRAQSGDGLWRFLFLLGLVAGVWLFMLLGGDVSARNINPHALGDTAHLVVLVAGGLLVGIGTQVGSGCTSGHGVCGLGRFSMRSLVATCVFMVVAAVTVIIVRVVTGG